jgi:lipopolysaccharide export system protein LptA
MGAAALLLSVVVAFFFYGRYRFRHITRDLPGRLGVNIQQTATEFSYSQSSQGHTLFTLKASKEFQMRSGHVLLHNVDITMYGPPGSGRKDHIYGSDFDYDQSEGIAISRGKVQIQLESWGAGGEKKGGAGASGIQVQTSGLTFVRQSGEASTSQAVHFALPTASGSSVGAEYNAKTGVLVLESQVHITTNSKGKTATIGAGHAMVDRQKMQAVLTEATLEYSTERGSADEATVDFRKDGTAGEIDARGNVRLATAQSSMAESGTGVILLNAKSEPLRADLGGGVSFAEARPGEQMQGTAGQATLEFGAASGPNGAKGATELRHAEFRGNVKFTQEPAEIAGNARGVAGRELEAQKVELEFASTAKGAPLEASLVIADGSPVLTMREATAKGTGLTQSTRISGDELVATMGAGNVLRELDGTGHTQIDNVSSDGARGTSRGDVLRATFRVQAAANRAGAPLQLAESRKPGGRDSGRKGKRSEQRPARQTVLETAVQDGDVVLTEIPANRPRPGGAGKPGGGPAEPLRAWADHAEYHAADEVLTLAGHPRLREGETMQLSAQQIVYHRESQDAEAEGDVKATYAQRAQERTERGPGIPEMGGNGPVHVVAGHAVMHHATGEAVFSGTTKERARMWQGADSLLAPTIEIDRREDVLKAWGDSAGPEVQANFASAMGAQHTETMVSVQSRRLDYSDKRHRGDFMGAVTAKHGDEAIHADDAAVILKPQGKAASGVPEQRRRKRNSEIESVVATGHVVMTQPGRRGEGAKLVYTADEGKYVLTGTPEAKPRLWDQVHGTTTGDALIFNSQNDSVEVSGGKSSAVTKTSAPR